MAKLVITNISMFEKSCCKNTVDDGYDLVRTYARDIEEMMVPFKTLLTQAFRLDKIDLENELLVKKFDELSKFLDEATVVLQSWNQMKSKFYFVLQIESVIARIRKSVLKSCDVLSIQLKHQVQECVCKIKSTVFMNISEKIQPRNFDKIKKEHPSPDILIEITSPLNLSTAFELLMEMVILKNLKLEVKHGGETHENIDHMIKLVTYIHNCFVEKHKVRTINNIKISPELCCPLSLHLMSDPVILASGQTYERCFIKEWLDRGFRVCPKTQETLVHNNLIPNYTVKDMIDNFCVKYNLKITQEVYNGGIGRFRQSWKSFHRTDQHISQTEWMKISALTETESSCTSTSYCRFSTSTSFQESIISVGSDEDTSQSGYIKYSPKSIHSRQLPSLSSVETKIYSIIEDMKTPDDGIKLHRDATDALRNITQKDPNERIVVFKCGAIDTLVDLLGSTSDSKTQENIVTCLHNLSLSDKDNKMKIGTTTCLNLLVHVLRTGNSVTKENSAATLNNLAAIDNKNKKNIGKSGAIEALTELLGHGTPREKKDATDALIRLSYIHENSKRIVEAGGVRYLIELIDPVIGLIEKAVTVLANIATTDVGRSSIAREGGIPVLVNIIELGTSRGKENAASALLQLCTYHLSSCREAIQEGVIPPLVALSRNGSSRAKEKANAILHHLHIPGNGNSQITGEYEQSSFF